MEEEKNEKKENHEEIKIKKEKNIITIYGAEGVGKTMNSILISKLSKKENALIEVNSEDNYDVKLIFNNKKNKINYYSENNLNKIKNIINKKENKNIIIDLGNKIGEEEKESLEFKAT